MARSLERHSGRKPSLWLRAPVPPHLGPVPLGLGRWRATRTTATVETEPQSMLSSAWKVVIGCHDAFRPRVLGLDFVGCRRRVRQKGRAPAGSEIRGSCRVGPGRAYGDGSSGRFEPHRRAGPCVRTQGAYVAGAGFLPDGAESEQGFGHGLIPAPRRGGAWWAAAPAAGAPVPSRRTTRSCRARRGPAAAAAGPWCRRIRPSGRP